jgi:hypothetical protein
LIQKFIERYKSLHATNNSITTGTNPRQASSKRRQNTDDTDTDESDNSDDGTVSSDPSKPWLGEWSSYIQTHEIVPEGMTMVKWWGVSSIPNWKSRF